MDRLPSWEIRIIVIGVQILTILTFLAFFGFAVLHLIKLFR